MHAPGSYYIMHRRVYEVFRTRLWLCVCVCVCVLSAPCARDRYILYNNRSASSTARHRQHGRRRRVESFRSFGCRVCTAALPLYAAAVRRGQFSSAVSFSRTPAQQQR